MTMTRTDCRAQARTSKALIARAYAIRAEAGAEVVERVLDDQESPQSGKAGGR